MSRKERKRKTKGEVIRGLACLVRPGEGTPVPLGGKPRALGTGIAARMTGAISHSPFSLTRFPKIKLFKAPECKHWGHGEPQLAHSLHLTPRLLQLISFTCWV